jgi:hypothetical protein
MMEGMVNLFKIHCDHICKCHSVSLLQLSYANQKKIKIKLKRKETEPLEMIRS